MFKIKICLLFYIVLCKLNFSDSAEFTLDYCDFSIGRGAVCKVLYECDFATQLRKNAGFFSPVYNIYLRTNFCGFHNYHPKVCCPNTKAKSLKHEFTNQKMKPVNSKHKSTNKKINLDNSNEKAEKSQIDKQQLLPEKCGVEISNRIIGGETMQLSEFPWLALLEYERSSEKVLGCGGSLISKRYVLTAAHCVNSISKIWKLKRVRLGEYNTKSELDCEPEGDEDLKCADQVLVVPIEQEIVHENFREPDQSSNDIALLRLSQEVKFTDYIQPVCLPQTSHLGDNYWAAGWGKTEFKSESSVKLKVALPRFDFDECKKIYAPKNIILGDGQMCAGGVSGKDTCAGDSGGPLVKFTDGIWIIDGIVSMGYRTCGENGWPAIYTKVFHYLPWILDKLEP